MITIYGIKNCDTMKKAFAWLDEHGIAYDFHDYKKLGIDRDMLERWEQTLGWEALLNTRGTTWRKLAPTQQADMNANKAIALMLELPSLIKRPVMENGARLIVGFQSQLYVDFASGDRGAP